ncbi:MAG: amidohydrolase family protein [Candidatus Lokiarchaeota archaeon]|nr:amidohydrolase family protein [Candidatus Lokiarchaeota archaeon]
MSSSSRELILKNSIIYDAKNQINGETIDLLIRDGKIVESLKDESSAQEIDGKGYITFPGFIDMRCHYYAQETIYHQLLNQKHNTRNCIASAQLLEKNALQQGFTFLCEMDVPPTQSKIALQNMTLGPLLDHLLIMDFGSNWAFMSDFETENPVETIAYTLSMLLGIVKGGGISITCPYHQQYWNLKPILPNSSIPIMKILPQKLYSLFTKAANLHNISPYFLSPYFDEDNPITLLSILKELGQQDFVLSTVNHYFKSEWKELEKIYSAQENLVCEVTPFTTDHVNPLITRDRNFALSESKHSGIPMIAVDVEFDTEYYITGRKFETDSPLQIDWVKLIQSFKKNCGLDRVILSSNAPYNMCISDWSKHLARLLTQSNHELDLFDISRILSTNPAQIIGLDSRKGHLGVGADADIVCFQGNPENINETLFKDSEIVMKNGNIVKKRTNLITLDKPLGKIFWTEGNYDPLKMDKLRPKKEKFYDKRFSMYLEALENPKISIMEKI